MLSLEPCRTASLQVLNAVVFCAVISENAPKVYRTRHRSAPRDQIAEPQCGNESATIDTLTTFAIVFCLDFAF